MSDDIVIKLCSDDIVVKQINNGIVIKMTTHTYTPASQAHIGTPLPHSLGLLCLALRRRPQAPGCPQAPRRPPNCSELDRRRSAMELGAGHGALAG